MTARDTLKPQLGDSSRFEGITSALIEAVKNASINSERADSKLNPSMLRKQILGSIASPSPQGHAANNTYQENVNVVLALYKDGITYLTDPTVVVADYGKQVYAAVVQTKAGQFANPQIVVRLAGPSCDTDVQALEELYKLSRGAVHRAMVFSETKRGFTKWEDLGLS